MEELTIIDEQANNFMDLNKDNDINNLQNYEGKSIYLRYYDNKKTNKYNEGVFTIISVNDKELSLVYGEDDYEEHIDVDLELVKEYEVVEENESLINTIKSFNLPSTLVKITNIYDEAINCICDFNILDKDNLKVSDEIELIYKSKDNKYKFLYYPVGMMKNITLIKELKEVNI